MTASLEAAAQTFQALGHPKRIAIIRWLLEQHAACCTGDPADRDMEPITCDFAELVDRLGVTKATVSHHVKTLVEADLIECQRDGRSLCCTVNRERLQLVKEVFSFSATE